jgi:hypothetical protein
MPSSDIADDEAALTRLKKATTPRRSPAVRRHANATPTRKVAANKRDTPNSAPARTKRGAKKAEPTLFTDFLLGRPSVSRARRKSLDVVPMEMKRSAVGKVQPPGGVKERVKQWQKASAAAVVEDAMEPPSEPDDISLDLDDESVTERDRRRIKFRNTHTRKPARRKSGDKDNPAAPLKSVGDKDNPTAPLKSVSSPRKRIVSDDHWVANKEKKSPPRTTRIIDELFSKGRTLPKDFLKNSANPPLEKKIEDWQKRTISNEGRYSEKQARKVLERVSEDEGIRIIPLRSYSPNHEIRVTPSKNKPNTDAAIEKLVDSEERRKRRQYDAEDYSTPRRRSTKHREPLPDIKESPKSRSPNAGIIVDEEESNSPCRTPTHPPRSKNRQRKSASPESLADIPVGYSAFSVLDIPVGGDANHTRLSKPQRQPSLSAVPKALKKVYTEGMKKVHDAVDPPRMGVNQPPSIESWLKGTSDPFLDDVSVPESVFEMAKPKARRQCYDTDTSYQKQDDNENEAHGNGAVERPSRGTPLPQRSSGDAVSNIQAGEPSVNTSYKDRKEIVTRPLSPPGLKRSPATRNTSSPKSVKHTPPRDLTVNSYNRESQSGAEVRTPSFSADGAESSSELKETKDVLAKGLEGFDREIGDVMQGRPSPRTPRTLDVPISNSRDLPDTKPYNAPNQRDRHVTGQRRLSTIASVETFKTSSSLTETSSELSDTTVTQTTITQNTSRTSNTSNASSYRGDKVSNQPNNNLGLKRRLTKHSDLLSVLSLPDASAPGRTKSIRSACSVRTTRTRLATATIPDLLRELADDEVKYMRELKTLVDGVVPVLLSCVLSRSDSAIAAGLFSQNSIGQTDTQITKPIIDMGIALEQLKSCHKRIPLHDPDLLVHWALGAHKIYEDYANAWRMGFQNVVINLAPASQSDSAETQSLDEMPRNIDGDMLNENGERVDVAFLLKRPLVRVKYLAKMMKVCLFLMSVATPAYNGYRVFTLSSPGNKQPKSMTSMRTSSLRSGDVREKKRRDLKIKLLVALMPPGLEIRGP